MYLRTEERVRGHSAGPGTEVAWCERRCRALDGSAVMWNHGGSADDLARPWAPMVAAPASGIFRVGRPRGGAGCERLTIVEGGGRFAAIVTRSRSAGGKASSLLFEVFPLGSWDPAKLSPGGAARRGEVRGGCAVVASPPAVIASSDAAAGIPAFGSAAGSAAEGVLGPVQWLATSEQPEVGPSGAVFERAIERATDRPSYVVAQAAAAGYLGGSGATWRHRGDPATGP